MPLKNPPKLDREVLLRVARTARPGEFSRAADFVRFLGITSQRWQNWKVRGVPYHAVRPITDLLGITEDELYDLAGSGGGVTELEEITEATLTNLEAQIIAAFRRANEEHRNELLALAMKAAQAAGEQPVAAKGDTKLADAKKLRRA